MSLRISEMQDAGTPNGSELVEVSQLSATVRRTSTGLSFSAIDSSINDAAFGFVSAGFTVGDTVRVSGSTSNDRASAIVTALTSGKMILGAALTTEAAGASVTVAQWVTRSTPLPAASGVESVVAGSGISIDNTDPVNPVISAASVINSAVTQNWFDVITKTKTPADPRILVQRATGSFDRLFIYVNHKANFYQRWELTRGGGTGDGFDNSVTTHPNGNMWFVNKVDQVLLGPTTEVAATSGSMTKSGTYATFGDDVRFTAGYAECTVTGTVIYLNYVARNDAGIANIYIDGVLTGTLDQYSTSAGGVLTAAKIAGGLVDTTHVVRIETTGTSHPDSSNTYVRVRSITGVSLQDYADVASWSIYAAAMANGSNIFKIAQAASELAVNTTLSGSTVWSGAYHKYCYPKVADNQKIYIDGTLVDFSDMAAGDLVLCNSVRLIQALEMSNVSTPIADITMQHLFTSDGCNVKYNLTWTAEVDVNRSYQAMWPTPAESAVLGGDQGKYVADQDNAYINAFKKSFNAVAVHSTNEWVSGFKSNNEAGADWPNDGYYGLYIWDRPTDFKIYLRKYSGLTAIGDVWLSDISFQIAHCPLLDEVLMLPVLPS